jgi:hypothetical protein
VAQDRGRQPDQADDLKGWEFFILDRLQADGLTCEPVNDLAGCTQSQRIQATGQLLTLPEVGLPIVRLPLSLEVERPPVRGRPPRRR